MMTSDDREVEGVWGFCKFLWEAYYERTQDSRVYDPMRVAPVDVQRIGPALGAWAFTRFVNMARSSAQPVTWEWEADAAAVEARQ